MHLNVRSSHTSAGGTRLWEGRRGRCVSGFFGSSCFPACWSWWVIAGHQLRAVLAFIDSPLTIHSQDADLKPPDGCPPSPPMLPHEYSTHPFPPHLHAFVNYNVILVRAYPTEQLC